MQTESFKKKLYIARDVEGRSNSRELRVLRVLEEKLEIDPTFIGLAPYGSSFSGYNVEGSDIDVHALYDWPINSKTTERDIQNTKDVAKKIIEQQGIKIQLNVANINPDIINYLDSELIKDPNQYISVILCTLTRIVTGKKISHYRRLFSEWIKRLPTERREEIIERTVDNLYKMDSATWDKRKERTKEISDSDLVEILSERKKMWRKRISKIYGL